MRYTYEEHFKSKRPDGRMTASLASFMEQLRRTKPELALPEQLDAESFADWQKRVKERLEALLCIPEPTPQPDPVLLSSVQRDGYRAETWECYPDDVTALPVLMLIPDKASSENKLPAVFCFPGSIFGKEFICGEPLPDHSPARFEKYPERNRMGLYAVKNGMIAVGFDPLSIGELSLPAENPKDYGGACRENLCYGLLEYGYNYLGVSVAQKLCFLRFLKTLPYVDTDRLAISAHSLGTELAICMGVLFDEFKAVVFNDFLCDPRDRYVSATEADEGTLWQLCGSQHILPGKFASFGYQDLCAAFAPRHLAINEGGADEYTETVRRAYEMAGAPQNFRLTYYPCYADPASRTLHGPIPKAGLDSDSYFKWSYVKAPDHSYREEPSMRLLRDCFGLDS